MQRTPHPMQLTKELNQPTHWFWISPSPELWECNCCFFFFSDTTVLCCGSTKHRLRAWLIVKKGQETEPGWYSKEGWKDDTDTRVLAKQQTWAEASSSCWRAGLRASLWERIHGWRQSFGERNTSPFHLATLLLFRYLEATLPTPRQILTHSQPALPKGLLRSLWLFSNSCH